VTVDGDNIDGGGCDCDIAASDFFESVSIVVDPIVALAMMIATSMT
jgi:hypothetical protein